MMGRIALGYLLLYLLFLIAASFCHAAGRRESGGKDSPAQNLDLPDYVLRDVTHYHYESGVLKVKALFDSGSFSRGSEELHVENCSFVYYDSSGSVVSKGSAKEATIFRDRSELIARGEVVVVSEVNGGKLETDYLEWHGTQNQFTTESFVTITRTNGDILQGIGMISDVALRYVTIKKNVRGTLRSK